MNQINYYDDSEYDNLTGIVYKIKDNPDAPKSINHATDKCYVTSNEELANYMDLLPMKNKRVATVGSSGDQALNALYYGSKDVTLIDANPYSRAFVEYKMAMIKNFDRKKFNEVFSDDRNVFSWITYRQISHDLSPDVQRFWDKLILEQDGDNYGIANSKDIYCRLLQGGFCRNSQFYHGRGYKKLQEILRKGDYSLNFINAELSDFAETLEGKFDAIILSNIMDYVDWRNFSDILEDLYEKKLNAGGIIQAYYEMYMEGEYLKVALEDYNIVMKIIHDEFPLKIWLMNKPLNTPEEDVQM